MPKNFTTLLTGSIFLIFILFFANCDQFGSKEEGEIIYGITYPDKGEQSDLMSNILPSEMIMRFKGTKSVCSFEIGLGMFKIAIVADSKLKRQVVLAKMMTKQYALDLDSTKVFEYNKSEQPEIILQETKVKKKILEFKCYEMNATMKDNPQVSFPVYYTKMVKIPNLHWNTPYHSIKYVLLDYQAFMNGMHMRFVAKKFENKKIEDSEFDIPANYKSVDMQTMKGFLPSFDK